MSRLVTHRRQDKSRTYLDVERPLGTVGMECAMYIEQVVACLLQEVTDLDVAGALCPRRLGGPRRLLRRASANDNNG